MNAKELAVFGTAAFGTVCLSGIIERMDQRMCEALGEPNVGVFIDTLIALLPTLLQLFSLCPKKPKPPTPPNPTPSPTPAQTKSWETAWDLKCHANDAWDSDQRDYNDHTVRVMSKKIRRQKKKDGTPISHDEGNEFAISSLDAARNEEMHVLAAAVEAHEGGV